MVIVMIPRKIRDFLCKRMDKKKEDKEEDGLGEGSPRNNGTMHRSISGRIAPEGVCVRCGPCV